MKYFIYYLRSFFVSFEFVLILLAVGLCWLHFDFVVNFEHFLRQEEEIIKWLALVPVGILVWLLTVIQKIHLPDKDSKALVQKWDGAWKLEIATNVALIYALLFAAIAVACWLVPSIAQKGCRNFLLVCALLGSCIVGFTCWRAGLIISLIVARHSEDQKKG